MIQEKPEKLTQRVHRDYLLRESEHFRDHKKGIPEWIKNSDDSYARHEVSDKIDYSSLPIFVNIGKKEIVCLDFGGATAKDLIEHCTHYGSPDAATQGKVMAPGKVSGGHGNGGKYYALSQFKECKIISYYQGKLTVLKLNKEGDYVCINGEATTHKDAIEIIGLNEWPYFNKKGIEIFDKIRKGQVDLFCWKGIEPRDKNQIDKRILLRLLQSIANNPQSRPVLRHRIVNVLFNGNLFFPSLKPMEVDPDESFGVRNFILPNKLGGFEFNTHHDSTLAITLSKEPLTGDKASLNILEIDAFSHNIAYYEIPQLLIDKGLSKSLYANIDCPELRDNYNCVNNDRTRLIEGSEVSDLFLEWCKEKLREVLDELTNKEKKKGEIKHLEELGSFLKEITSEISELLEEENILKASFKPDSNAVGLVETPTNKPGYGNQGEIKHKGGGSRLGGKEEKEAGSEPKKSKSKLQILLSNHDPDPLNPGKTFDMIEREPVLHQRVEDVDYGIWWINTQKSYIKKINIKDPGAMQFYFFLVKEVVLSHRTRRLFREQERYDPDGIEELNFLLIDEIFNRVAQKLGIELSTDQTIANKIREAIKSKNEFTASALADEINVNPMYINTFISDHSNGVLENFSQTKDGIRYIYTRKSSNSKV